MNRADLPLDKSLNAHSSPFSRKSTSKKGSTCTYVGDIIVPQLISLALKYEQEQYILCYEYKLSSLTFHPLLTTSPIARATFLPSFFPSRPFLCPVLAVASKYVRVRTSFSSRPNVTKTGRVTHSWGPPYVFLDGPRWQ